MITPDPSARPDSEDDRRRLQRPKVAPFPLDAAELAAIEARLRARGVAPGDRRSAGSFIRRLLRLRAR